MSIAAGLSNVVALLCSLGMAAFAVAALGILRRAKDRADAKKRVLSNKELREIRDRFASIDRAMASQLLGMTVYGHLTVSQRQSPLEPLDPLQASSAVIPKSLRRDAAKIHSHMRRIEQILEAQHNGSTAESAV